MSGKPAPKSVSGHRLAKEEKPVLLEAAKSAADPEKQTRTPGSQEIAPASSTSTTRRIEEAESKSASSSGFGKPPSSDSFNPPGQEVVDTAAERKDTKTEPVRPLLEPDILSDDNNDEPDDDEADYFEPDEPDKRETGYVSIKAFEAMTNQLARLKEMIQQQPLSVDGNNLVGLDPSRIPLMKLPILKSMVFKEIVQWENKLRNVLLVNEPGKFNAIKLLAPSITKHLEAVLDHEQFARISDLEQLVLTLYDTFMPINNYIKTDLLLSVHFIPPYGKFSVSDTYLNAVVAFNIEFVHMAKALRLFNLRSTEFAKIYIDSLPDDFGKAIRKDLRYSHITFKVASDYALELAKYFDTAHVVSDYKPAYTKPSFVKRFSTQRSNSHNSFSTSASYKSTMVPTCYNCGVQGHKRNECPVLLRDYSTTSGNPATKPLVSAVEPVSAVSKPYEIPFRRGGAPSISSSSNQRDFSRNVSRPGSNFNQHYAKQHLVQTKTVRPEPKSVPAPTRKVSYNTSVISEVDATHLITVEEVDDSFQNDCFDHVQVPTYMSNLTENPVEKSVCQDFESPLVFHSSEDSGLMPSADKKVNVQRPRLMVKFCLGEGIYSVCCLLDTGSDKSEINESYVNLLGLSKFVVQAAKPVLLSVGNGFTTRCDYELVLPLRFHKDAPITPVHCIVTPNIPSGNFLLVGLADLHNYVIGLFTPPTVEYRLTPAVEDLADSVEFADSLPVTNPGKPLPSTLIKWGDKISSAEKVSLTKLVDSFEDVFDSLSSIPAKLPPFSLELMANAIPVHSKQRYYPKDHLNFMDSELTKLVAQNIILKVPGGCEWGAAPVIAKKKDGSLRLCFDYRFVNRQTKKVGGYMPYADEIFTFIAHKPYLASFDMTSGYNQVAVDEATSFILAMTTPFGEFRPLRATFGPMNVPPHFQSVIRDWLQVNLNCYARNNVDDTALAAIDFKSFKEAISILMNACRRDNIRLNAKKCQIGPVKLNYLGRIVGPNSVEIDKSRLEPIQTMCAPYDRATLLSFIGLVNWFSKWIPHCATLLAPLNNLNKKNVIFKWNEVCDKSFEAIRDAILKADVLEQVIPGWRFKLITDASNFGIAAMLSQIDDDNREHVILFLSRKLTTAEMKYPIPEKEALAITWSLNKCKPFILGISPYPILIQTDHSNLQWLAKSDNPRIGRWCVLNAEFDYVIEYIPGRNNTLADFLSRSFKDIHVFKDLPDATFSNADIQMVMVGQPNSVLAVTAVEADAIRHQILNIPHQTNEKGTLSLSQSPPVDILEKLFALAHDDPLCGHGGVAKTVFRLRTVLDWPKMTKDVAKYVAACPVCQKLKAKPSVLQERASTTAKSPLESVFMDIIGPYPETKNGFKYILNMLDRFSHRVVLVPLKDMKATTVMESFYEFWICDFGTPKFSTFDGGKSFVNECMHAMEHLLQIQRRVCIPYYPEGHGVIERSNRCVNFMVRSLVHQYKVDWNLVVKPIQFAINNGFNRAIGCAPNDILLSVKLVIPLGLALAEPIPDVISDVDPVIWAKNQAIVGAKIIQQAANHEAAYFKHEIKKVKARSFIPTTARSEFYAGEYVLIKKPAANKLEFDWVGPYLVIGSDTQNHNGVYVVADLGTGVTQRVHVLRMHLFFPGTLTASQLKVISTKDDEFYVEAVIGHNYVDDELWLDVKWLGYDYNADDSWVKFADAKDSPVVRDYTQLHGLLNKRHRVDDQPSQHSHVMRGGRRGRGKR